MNSIYCLNRQNDNRCFLYFRATPKPKRRSKNFFKNISELSSYLYQQANYFNDHLDSDFQVLGLCPLSLVYRHLYLYCLI